MLFQSDSRITKELVLQYLFKELEDKAKTFLKNMPTMERR